jgi:hypothetical protein
VRPADETVPSSREPGGIDIPSCPTSSIASTGAPDEAPGAKAGLGLSIVNRSWTCTRDGIGREPHRRRDPPASRRAPMAGPVELGTMGARRWRTFTNRACA